MNKIEEHYNKVFQGKTVRVDAVDENGNRIYAGTDTYYECRLFCILHDGDKLNEQYLLALRHFSLSGFEDGVLVLEEPRNDGTNALEDGYWWYAEPDKEEGNIFNGHKRYCITFLFI